jgi:hypothetical protein
MSDLSVDSLTLTIASMRVGSSSTAIDDARATLKGMHGALAGTPAEGAFGALAASAVSTSTGFAHASTALSGALKRAASAYDAADASVAAIMRGTTG